MATSGHKSIILPESKIHYPPPRDFHTSHIKIELQVDLEKKSISGACTLDIEPFREDLSAARLDACQLNVRKATADGTDSGFEYDGAILRVPLKPGRRHRVTVEYAATPRRGVYFTGTEEEVQAWSHSEAQDARYWYPCRDHPGDRSSSELVMTVPKGYRVISNGRLLATTEGPQTTTFHWKEEVPHVTYLTSFVVGKFEEMTQESNGVPLRYNFPASKKEDVLRYFGETPRMIKVFEDLTGVKYPYPKYDQTTVHDFVAGGEENLDATTLGMQYYPDASSEEDFAVSYSLQFQRPVDLVSHELAHQWFGDLVTCSDWAHAWLNEGFASYFQELYLEKTRGRDEAVWHLERRLEEYFDEDETEYRRPIVERRYVSPDDLFDSHLYPKAAACIQELRFLMGDEAFFRGINAYLKAFSLSVADTDDLRKALEKSSGMQLQEFFEQAFHRPGHPEFEVDYAWDDGRGTATLHVRQVQITDDGTPVYRLPCEVAFYVGGNRSAFKVLLESADQTLTFTLPSRPTVVEFDPGHWLLKKLRFSKSIDLLLNQLRGSESAWSRVDAARELGKLKSDMAVEGLARAAAQERFWFARSLAYGALGETGTDRALKAIFDAGAPEDRRARRGFAEALGKFKDEKAREELLRLLGSDESPYVRCEAALALARSWPEGAFSHLKEAMKVHTANETLAEACIAAMGKLKEPEVNGIILGSLVEGRPARVRVGALKAIKERGRILDDEVPIIREILRSVKEFRVRLQAVNNLIRPLGDVRFVDDMKACADSEPHYSIKRKALETYHELSSSVAQAAALEKLKAEVEELKKENSRLATPPA